MVMLHFHSFHWCSFVPSYDYLHIHVHCMCVRTYTHTHTHVQLPHTINSPDRSLREAAISERLNPNLEGLTLATYLKEPEQIIMKTAGLPSLDPIEEEGEGHGVMEELEEDMDEEAFEENERPMEGLYNLQCKVNLDQEAN